MKPSYCFYISRSYNFVIVVETTTSYKYIVRKEGSGEPIFQHTRIAVRDVVEQWKMGASPEEISVSLKSLRRLHTLSHKKGGNNETNFS
ncbi:MAG: hypothetical protein C4326_10850 [Ignavibacteria bacterium]